MSDPQVKQIRRPIQVAGGGRKYEVTTIVVDKGDLPFAEVFVVTIVDPSDPKADVYARVAEPLEFYRADGGARYVKVDANDLVTVSGDPFARVVDVEEFLSTPRDRAVAVSQGRATYLTSAIVLLYDSLAGAKAAHEQLIDRLSTLVEDWRTATGAFVTNPYELYTLPRTAASVEAQRVAAWRTAKETRVAAEARRDLAVAAADACATECAADNAAYATLVADVTFLQRAKDYVTSLTETLSTNVKTFVLNGSNPISYETLLTQKSAQLATARERVLACESSCRDKRQAATDAQGLVDAARRDEHAALARVLDICPTFDPGAA